MQLKLVAAVLSAVLAIVVAQDADKDGYQIHPKFKKPEAPEAPEVPKVPEVPEYKKPEVPEQKNPEVPEYESPEVPEFEKPAYPETPAFPEYKKPEFSEYKHPEYPEYKKPEFPKFEKPEYPDYKEPEFVEFKKPEVPEYEHPKYPEYKEHEEPKYPEHSYPSFPQYYPYGYHNPAPYYYVGHPDFSAPQPKVMEEKDGDYTPHDSKMKMEKKDGDYTPHDSKMKMEKKDGDYTPHDSKMEENKVEEHEGFPVFNFHEYQAPKIEEHNFDNFIFNLTGYNPKDGNSTDSDYYRIQESREVPATRSYQSYNNYYPSSQYPAVPSSYTPHAKVEYNQAPAAHGYPYEQPAVYPQQQAPVYAHHVNNYPQPGYQQQYPVYPANNGNKQQYHNTVEKQGSYYRLDTCEYRFILDMVQCHQEERYSEKVNVQSTGQGHHYQGQAPQYYDNNNYYYNPAGQQPNNYNGYPYQAPYDSRYTDFMRLYGNPMYYANHATGHSYKPGHFDDSLFSYSPSVGHPFYAPGLHNTPFAKYYAGFKAGNFEQGHESETRNYHKEGYYQSALQDFHNLQLKNVIKVDAESQSSVKTSSKVSVSDEVGYEGSTPSFSYRVRLLPNHCTVPGYGGRHTCIVFSGATYPYRMVHRQFIYLKNTREVQGNYRYRYENGQQQVHH